MILSRSRHLILTRFSHYTAPLTIPRLSKIPQQFAMSFSTSYSKINPTVFRPGNQVQTKIELTETEHKIRNLIVDFCKYHDKQTSAETPLVARFTGGWVRDKLLGFESHDIDIAINTLTGLEFAEGINEYIEGVSKGNPSPELQTHTIHKIERNPEKSKHLETATTKLFDQEVDIVNLRSEEYAEDSRIPTMAFGTAEEDAFRRDATVNALFYNLQEDKVEDFTGTGLQDLKEGIIRTPLAPFQTFDDDPLRVLRLIRFASTFGFEIDSETLDAMSNPKIKEALMLKISRERVGVELTKALTSSRPQACLLLLYYLGLYDAVFYLDPRNYPSKDYILPENNMKAAIEAVSATLSNADPYLLNAIQPSFYGNFINPSSSVESSSSPSSSLTKQQLANNRLHFWLAVSLSHFDNIISGDLQAAVQKHKDQATLRAHVIRTGIKLSTNDSKVVSDMENVYDKDKMSFFAHENPQQFLDSLTRLDLGRMVRRFGENWGLTLLYCLFQDILKLHQSHNISSSPSSSQRVTETEQSIQQFYSTFVAKILNDQNDLEHAWALKPILNGKEVLPIFGKKGGPWLNNVLAALMDRQLENPYLSKEEAKNWLQENKDQWV